MVNYYEVVKLFVFALVIIVIYYFVKKCYQLYHKCIKQCYKLTNYISRKYNIDIYENERLLEENQKLKTKNCELIKQLSNKNNDHLYYFYHDKRLRYGYTRINSNNNNFIVDMYSNINKPYYIKSNITTLAFKVQSRSTLKLIDQLSIEDLKKCDGFLSPIDENVYNDIKLRFLYESNIIYLLKLTLHDDNIIFKVGKTTQFLFDRIKKLRTEKYSKNIFYKSIIPLDIYIIKGYQNISYLENHFLDEMDQEFSHILDKEYYGGFENQIVNKFRAIKNSI